MQSTCVHPRSIMQKPHSHLKGSTLFLRTVAICRGSKPPRPSQVMVDPRVKSPQLSHRTHLGCFCKRCDTSGYHLNHRRQFHNLSLTSIHCSTEYGPLQFCSRNLQIIGNVYFHNTLHCMQSCYNLIFLTWTDRRLI